MIVFFFPLHSSRFTNALACLLGGRVAQIGAGLIGQFSEAFNHVRMLVGEVSGLAGVRFKVVEGERSLGLAVGSCVGRWTVENAATWWRLHVPALYGPE